MQKSMEFLEKATTKEQKLEMLETLRTVTEGKIFVEVERARLTRTLVQIKESEGKTEEACDILQEVQVETIGTMDKREKTSYILDQMRLCLAKGDLIRTQIISKKINTTIFKDDSIQDLKVKFYHLMIQKQTTDKVDSINWSGFAAPKSDWGCVPRIIWRWRKGSMPFSIHPPCRNTCRITHTTSL